MDASILVEHREAVTRLIAARVGPSSVDDVLQEVALAVQRSERLPSDYDEARNWLCSVAVRQCALIHRKNERYQRMVTSAATRVETGEGDQSVDPMHWLLARESQEQMRAALQKLDQQSRKLLVRKIVGGATYDQMADEFSLSRDTVQYRVLAAKRRLRNAMLEQGYAEGDV